MTKEEGLIKILREMDKKRVEELDKNTKKVFDAVMKIADERDKYKSLYENEKSHVDTLKRIIKKIEEYIRNINDWEICSKYDGIYKDEVLEILDLLKEIK